jgi:hypothetical protein
VRRRVNPAIDPKRAFDRPVRQPVAAAPFDRGADLGQTGALVMVAGNGVNVRDLRNVPDAPLQCGQPLAVVRQVAAQQDQVRRRLVHGTDQLPRNLTRPPPAQVQVACV